MKDDEFEWDNAKAELNAKSHKISFQTAQKVFNDPGALPIEDTDSSWEEDRYRKIGSAEGRVITLSYTYRGDVIRLISARRATKREKDDYYRSQSPP